MVPQAHGTLHHDQYLVCDLSAIVEDDDEILLALAEALGQLVPAVGGPAHAALLLPR